MIITGYNSALGGPPLGVGIHQAVARDARHYAMTVLRHHTHRLSAEVEKRGYAAYVFLEEVRARADVPTIHLRCLPVMPVLALTAPVNPAAALTSKPPYLLNT